MSRPAGGPEVRVEAAGPYRVSGSVILRRKRIVYSDSGDSLTWQAGASIPHPDELRLCRCGESSDKPFCDNSHRKSTFDGTETASTSDRSERLQEYPGVGLTLSDDRSLCEHAGFCTNQVTSVWKMMADTGDPVTRSQVIAMIERCPSGALTYEIDGVTNEPDLPVEIAVVDDGPLWLTGGIAVVRSDGQLLEPRNRITLCRCGKSKNKPLCDGSHWEPDAGEEPHPKATKLKSSGSPTLGPVVVHTAQPTRSAAMRVAAGLAASGTSTLDIVYTGSHGDEADPAIRTLNDLAVDAGMPEDRIRIAARKGGAVGSTIDLAEKNDAGLIVTERGAGRAGHEVHQLRGAHAL